MTDQKTLTSYIEERVRSGASKQSITEQLTAVGWSEDEAESAYASALVAVGVPVPEGSTAGQHQKRATTMDVVLIFITFILLWVFANAHGTLNSAVID